jgi:hypothetical protein
VSIRCTVGQVYDLPSLRSTRPGPLFSTLHQPRPHRIPFDVIQHAFKFLSVAHPVIIRFVLPKSQPRSTKNHIGPPGAGALDHVCDSPQRFVWLQQNMHVVRHDHLREEIIKSPFFTDRQQCFSNRRSRVRVLKEHRAGTRSVQLPIHQQEPPPLRQPSGAGLRPALPQAARKRSVETPGQEYEYSFRLPVRQSTTIEAHANEVACGIQSSHLAGRRPAPQLCLS